MDEVRRARGASRRRYRRPPQVAGRRPDDSPAGLRGPEPEPAVVVPSPSELVHQAWSIAGLLTLFVREVRTARATPAVEEEAVELLTALRRIADQVGVGVGLLQECTPADSEPGRGSAADLVELLELVDGLVDEHRMTIGRRLDIGEAQRLVAQVIGPSVFALDSGLSRLGYGLSVEVVETPHDEHVWATPEALVAAAESEPDGDGLDVDDQGEGLDAELDQLASPRTDPLADGRARHPHDSDECFGDAAMPVAGTERVPAVQEGLSDGCDSVAGVPFH